MVVLFLVLYFCFGQEKGDGGENKGYVLDECGCYCVLFQGVFLEVVVNDFY